MRRLVIPAELSERRTLAIPLVREAVRRLRLGTANMISAETGEDLALLAVEWWESPEQAAAFSAWCRDPHGPDLGWRPRASVHVALARPAMSPAKRMMARIVSLAWDPQRTSEAAVGAAYNQVAGCPLFRPPLTGMAPTSPPVVKGCRHRPATARQVLPMLADEGPDALAAEDLRRLKQQFDAMLPLGQAKARLGLAQQRDMEWSQAAEVRVRATSPPLRSTSKRPSRAAASPSATRRSPWARRGPARARAVSVRAGGAMVPATRASGAPPARQDAADAQPPPGR